MCIHFQHGMHDDHPYVRTAPQVSSTKCRAGHRAETRQTWWRSAVEFFSSVSGCGARCTVVACPLLIATVSCESGTSAKLVDMSVRLVGCEFGTNGNLVGTSARLVAG